MSNNSNSNSSWHQRNMNNSKMIKVGPMLVEQLVDLNEFGVSINSDEAHSSMHGKFITCVKRGDQSDQKSASHVLIELQHPHTQHDIPTISKAIPYVSPTGKHALAMLVVLKSLVVYDVETKKKVASCNFDVDDCCFCKWVSADTIVFITSSAVFHWLVGERQPIKIFDRHPSNCGSLVRDYIVHPSGDWVVLIPKTLKLGNTEMQLFSLSSKKSKIIRGYAACLSTCGKGISIQVEHIVLSYATFENNSNSVFRAIEMDWDFEEDRKRSVTIHIPSSRSPIPDHRGHCVGIHASEKYGVAFYFTSLGWLYLLGLDKDDLLFEKQFNIISTDGLSGNNVFTSIVACFSGEGIIAIHSSGKVLQLILNEDVVIPYLVEEVGNAELAKYWAWRTIYYQQDQQRKQLEDQKLQQKEQQDYKLVLDEQHNKQQELRRSLHEVQQRLLDDHLEPEQQIKQLHRSLSELQPLVQQQQEELKKLEEQKQRIEHQNSKHFERTEQHQYNLLMLRQIRKHQNQLQEPLRMLKKDPDLPFRFGLRYCTVEYERHINIRETMQGNIQKVQLQLEKQEKQISSLTKKQKRQLEEQLLQPNQLLLMFHQLEEQLLQDETDQKEQVRSGNQEAKINPLKVEEIVDITRLGADLNSTVLMKNEFVSFKKVDMEYEILNLNDMLTEITVPTLLGAHPYVSPTGDLAFAKLDAINILIIYDLKTQNTIVSCNSDLTSEIEFCKWIDSDEDEVALISSTTVYHWDWKRDDEPRHMFDRHPSTLGPVHDYICGDSRVYSFNNYLVVPKTNLSAGENGIMQLFDIQWNNFVLVRGYIACFTDSRSNFLPPAEEMHTLHILSVEDVILCYAKFEDDGSTSFHAQAINNGQKTKRSKRLLSVPIFEPKLVTQKDYCVGIRASPKYGFAFFLMSSGWLYLFGLDSDDCLFKCKLNDIFLNNNTNIPFTAVLEDLNWDFAEGVTVLHSSGNILKVSLDEEVIIPHLLHVLKNSELAKYAIARASFYEEKQHENDLQEQVTEQGRLADHGEQLRQHRTRQQALQRLFNNLQQMEPLQRNDLSQYNDVLKRHKREVLKNLEEADKHNLERKKTRDQCHKYNRDSTRLRDTQVQQLQKERALGEFRQHPDLPFRFGVRYVPLPYSQMVDGAKWVQESMVRKQAELQIEEDKLQVILQQREQELKNLLQEHDIMQSQLTLMIGEKELHQQQQLELAIALGGLGLGDEPRSSSSSLDVSTASSGSFEGMGGCGQMSQAVKPPDDDTTDKNLCIICVERQYNTVLLPCRHMWLCYQCATAVFAGDKQCPACRSDVEDIMCVFTPD